MSEQCGAETTSGEPCQNNADSCPWHTNEDTPDTSENGRPSKFNEEREKQALKAAAMGKSKAGCARSAGVGKATLERWLDEHDSFRNAFTRARAQGEEQLIDGGLRDENVDSSFAKFLLSTSFDYVKTEKREISGAGGSGIEIVLGDDDE